MKDEAKEGRRGRSSWEQRGTRSWEAKEDRRGRSSWGQRGSRSWGAKEGGRGRSRLGPKATRRWGAKVGSAPWTSLEVSVLKKKAFISMKPSSEPLPEV